MTDWRPVAAAEGWTTFARSVRVPLGARRHTVHVLDLDYEWEFYAAVPQSEASELVTLLAENRKAGLAYWHVQEGNLWAVSRCPRDATREEIVAYLSDTASLADRFELRRSETDL